MAHVEDILLLNKLFPIVDTCLSCEDIARRSCAMVPRWRFLATFLRPVFAASRVQHISDLIEERKKKELEMWANAQRDGRPVEYRWRPLFNAV